MPTKHSVTEPPLKHTPTPGPWTIGADRARVIAPSLRHPDANPIAHVYDRTEMDGNALLIAAAPDMLQALSEVEGECYYVPEPGEMARCTFCQADEDEPHEPECTMHFVLAAIAKVEGR